MELELELDDEELVGKTVMREGSAHSYDGKGRFRDEDVLEMVP